MKTDDRRNGPRGADDTQTPEDGELELGERFKSRKVALEWLRNQGAAVSQGKFYQDCNAGKIIVFPDKTVSRASVLQYLINIMRDNPVFDHGGAELLLKEQQLKVKKLELEVERLERNSRADDRRWMLREDAWAMLAGVLGMLRQNFDYHVNQRAGELALAVEGREEHAPQLVDMLLLHVVNPAFNDLSGQTLQDACFAYMPENEVEP